MKKLLDELKDIQGHTGRKDPNAIFLCTATPLMVELGFPPQPVLLTVKHFRNMTRPMDTLHPGYHGLSVETVAHLPLLLAAPAMVIPGKRDAYIFLSDTLDSNGWPVIAVVQPNAYGWLNNKPISCNFLLSAYGWRTISHHIPKLSANEILYADTKRAKELLECLRVQFPQLKQALLGSSIILQPFLLNVNSEVKRPVSSNEILSNYKKSTSLQHVLQDENTALPVNEYRVAGFRLRHGVYQAHVLGPDTDKWFSVMEKEGARYVSVKGKEGQESRRLDFTARMNQRYEEFCAMYQRNGARSEICFQRIVRVADLTFEQYLQQKGIDPALQARSTDYADLIGGAVTAQTAAARGKLKAPAEKIQQTSQWQNEYAEDIAAGTVSSHIEYRPLVWSKEADRAYARTRILRAHEAGMTAEEQQWQDFYDAQFDQAKMVSRSPKETQANRQLAPGDRLWLRLANCKTNSFILLESQAASLTAVPCSTAVPKTADGTITLAATSQNGLTRPLTVDLRQAYIFAPNLPFVRSGRLSAPDFERVQAGYAQQQKEKAIRTAEARLPDRPAAAAQGERERLKSEITKLCAEFQADPEKYAEYLQFRSRFYQYSNRNALLIYLQNPYARFVGSKTAFASHGINILPGQEGQGMEIYRPNKIELFNRDGTSTSVVHATPEERAAISSGEIRTWTKTTYRLEMVYDIAQTDCPTSEYPALLNLGESNEQAAELFQQVKRLAMDTGVPVLEKNLKSATLGGFYNRAENTITINTLGNDTKKLTVMAHEYAHAMLHRTSSASKAIKEFEAESLAVLLQSRLGVPPAEGDVRYVKNYLEQCKAEPQFSLEKSMERIHRQLQFITEKLDLRSQLEYGLAPQHEAGPEKTLREPPAQAVLHEPEAPVLEELYANFIRDL